MSSLLIRSLTVSLIDTKMFLKDWVDFYPAYFTKFSKVKVLGIEPMTSWPVVRHTDHSHNDKYDFENFKYKFKFLDHTK